MGREVRRVPANWEHPKNADGRYIPLHCGGFSERIAEWDKGAEMWSQGKRLDYSQDGEVYRDIESKYSETSYAEFDGKRPVESDYMPDWPESERTHWQMYESTSEGTPISPVMETPEQLAHWLADNNASAFGDMTATYEQWLATINRGFAPSMMIGPAGMQSGVEALTDK